MAKLTRETLAVASEKELLKGFKHLANLARCEHDKHQLDMILDEILLRREIASYEGN